MPPPNTPTPSAPQPPNPFLETVLNAPTPHAPPLANTPTPPPPPPPQRTPKRSVVQSAQEGMTAGQLSLQARGKPYGGMGAGAGAGASAGSSGGGSRGGNGTTASGAEPYEQRQRRNQAASVLENMEMLIWYSGARGESISQTRQHFQNVVLGIEDRDDYVVWREEWEVPVEERSRGEEGRLGASRSASASASPARGIAKGKERVRKRV